MKKILVMFAAVLLIAAACEKKNDQILVPPTENTGEGNQATSTPDQTLNWQSYTSAQNGFSVKYTSDLGFQTDYKKVEALGYLPVCDESMAACVFVADKKPYTGTNFENAGVSINTRKDLNNQAKCYNFKAETSEAQTPAADVSINGIVFKSATGGQGAAGHFSKVQVYRNFHNNTCYELALRVSSTNIGNYDPGTIKQFDENALWGKMLEVVTSFKFTANESSQISISGTTVCLPHKNAKPGQPQTLECAIGLQANDNHKFYGLKNTPGGFYDTNVKVTVTGVLVQNPQSNYDVAGDIEVSKIERQ